MSHFDRIRRQQLLREAEGYLDLIMVLGDRWPLEPSVRDRLVQRTLKLLDELQDAGAPRGYLLYLEGQALRSMVRYLDAIPPLQAAAEDDPGNVHVWLALGWCYKRVDRLDLAIESLEEALVLDPSQAIVHYNLACYWSLARNVQQALHYLSQAFEIDSNFRDRVDRETDFDPIRSHHEFQMLTSVVV